MGGKKQQWVGKTMLGLKKPPQGSRRDLCQLLKVLNSFPSAAAGAAEIHGSVPKISPFAAHRGINSGLGSFSSMQGPTTMPCSPQGSQRCSCAATQHSLIWGENWYLFIYSGKRIISTKWSSQIQGALCPQHSSAPWCSLVQNHLLALRWKEKHHSC